LMPPNTPVRDLIDGPFLDAPAPSRSQIGSRHTASFVHSKRRIPKEKKSALNCSATPTSQCLGIQSRQTPGLPSSGRPAKSMLMEMKMAGRQWPNQRRRPRPLPCETHTNDNHRTTHSLAVAEAPLTKSGPSRDLTPAGRAAAGGSSPPWHPPASLLKPISRARVKRSSSASISRPSRTCLRAMSPASR
jgi:hypothetical protein